MPRARATASLPLAVVLTLVASAMLGGCKDGDTALRLRLIPDLQLNSERELLAAMTRMEIILDASEGFSGVAQGGQTIGSLVTSDVDGDGVVELVLSRDVSGHSSLPRYQLFPGNNADRSFAVVARGLGGQSIVATGGVSTVRFVEGDPLDVLVPFNLRAAYRPPRVLITLPHDGQGEVPRALDQVYVEFSKVIDPKTIAGQLQVIYESAAGDRPLDGDWSTAYNAVVDLGITEQRSTATLKVHCTLNPGTYRIEARPSVRDQSGRELDQDASRDGAEGYVGRFTIDGASGVASIQPCAEKLEGCQDSSQCNPPGEELFQCVVNGNQGTCIPRGGTCDAVKCPPGLVCRPVLDPAGNGVPDPNGTATCVYDCRQAGGCGEKLFCDPQTGVCRQCLANEPCQPPEPPPICDPQCMKQCTTACEQECLQPNGQPTPDGQQCLEVCLKEKCTS